MKIECVFCGRSTSSFEILGRRVCATCWDTIALISLKAMEMTILKSLSETIKKIQDGE